MAAILRMTDNSPLTKLQEMHSCATGYIDFDGSLVTGHFHFKLHSHAAGRNPAKWCRLGFYAIPFAIKELLHRDNTYELERFAYTLKGANFDQISSRLIPQMRLNPNLTRVSEVISLPASLIILSKNDQDLIQRAVEALQNQLLAEFGITIEGIIANEYEKVDGVYTGNAVFHICGNKRQYFEGKYFFSDTQDKIRYGDYEKFVCLSQII